MFKKTIFFIPHQKSASTSPQRSDYELKCNILKLCTLIIGAGLILGLALASQSVLAIGQVTKPIVIKDILRGQEVTASLDLFNSEEEQATFGLKAEGEIADWASFYQIEDKNLESPITEVQIPPESYLKATVKFTIPEDVPNGEHSGKVYVFTLPTKDEDTGEMKITVAQRIGRKVSITVTDQEIFDFDTTIIPLKYLVEKGEPLKIKTIYNNQGNVLIKPDIQLKITQSGQTVFNAIFPYPEDEEPVRPFERRVFPSLIEWQTTGQPEGAYKADIEVLINGEAYQQKGFKFNIGNPGAVAGASAFNFKIIWPIVLAVLLLAVVLLLIKNFKLRSIKNGKRA